MTFIWVNAKELEDERRRHREAIERIQCDNAALKTLLGCYQEGKLDAAFDITTELHMCSFVFTREMIEADPCIEALTAVIARQVSASRPRITPWLSANEKPGTEPEIPHSTWCALEE